ncbi:MAG TPA: AraC family transcriptional regulator [Candidatus Acidoferrales bacterium]|nr:AraC family transcriptional regulator [Candidatus Acidoferrales bacterium]
MKMRPALLPGAEPDFFSPQVSSARRFYLNLRPPSGSPLAVVCGGVENSAPDYGIHRETFPYYSIEYVVRGRGELRLAGSRHAIQPGRLFAYGPLVPHQISGSPNDPLVKYFLDFCGTFAPKLMRTCRLSPGSVVQVFPPHSLVPLFDECIWAGLRGGARGAKLSSDLLVCLVQKISLASAPLKSRETLAFDTFQHCRTHIEKHFSRLRTLAQIAGECHVNNAYLCRLFRSYDQQSPYQYLLRLKMNYAAEKLQCAGALVKQVAEETGFADPFHFSRVFKSVLGLSPDAFRRIR